MSVRTMRRGATFLAVTVVSVLGVGACGSSTGPPQVRTRSIPTGATDVVIRVDTRGGFTPVEYQLSIVPELTIYGDGRVIVTGPVTEQYPPRALPNLLTGRLDRAAVVALIDRARTDRLLETVDFGEPQITDNPTTTVTVNDGSEHVQRVYALGVESEPHELDDPTSPAALRAALGLTDAQTQSRRRLQDFVTAAENSASRVATEPYASSEVAIYVRPTDPVAADDPVEAGHAAWPLGDLTSFGSSDADTDNRCGVLTGADAATALAAAARATNITRWESGGSTFSIVWRPLLPDEHTCP